MRIPKYWARASEGGRMCVGWSETSASEAESRALEKVRRLLASGDGAAGSGWDYYPSTVVQEEILETRKLPDVTAVVTRNRAGALVLNTDRVAFVDVDLGKKEESVLGALGRMFGKKKPRGPDPAEEAALARAKAWAEANRARLRAYRTARGLRLLRMDALLDPTGEECARMFEALGADPQYARLCRVQESFRARLTPKPRRVGCSEAPSRHPRTAEAAQAAFERWLARYEKVCEGRAVCALVGELGSAAARAPAQAVAALHDPRTLHGDGALV